VKEDQKKSEKMATNKSSNPLTAMSAGCIAGAVEATVVWPMEFMKTRLQLGANSGSKLPYNGVLQGLSYTVRTTGFLRYVVTVNRFILPSPFLNGL
jgi:hypothetical protein